MSDPSIRECISYLRRYQAWRSGDDDRTLDEAGLSVAEITRHIVAMVDHADLHEARLAEANLRAENCLAQAEAAEARAEKLVKALQEIEWSNNTVWQRDRARAALADNGAKQSDAALSLIVAERARQISVKGWTPEHDDTHTNHDPETGATYSHDEIEAACGGEVALMVAKNVKTRRAAIDADMAKEGGT